MSVSHQAVQCKLDSCFNQVLLSPVGVGTHPTHAVSGLVGVVKPQPDDMDSLKPPERIYRIKVDETKLFGGWSLGELQQAQEADPDITPIRAWIEASEECPP